MLQDVIHVQDQYYILATAERADDRTRVLKHQETFAVFSRSGDIRNFGRGEHGLYHEGTRFLSWLELRLGAGHRPLYLGSTIQDVAGLLTVNLTNPDMDLGGHLLPRDALHILRAKFLWDGACHERLRVTNYGALTVTLPITLDFEADFADVFEVRGMSRERRGAILPAQPANGEVEIAYEGLDGVRRRLRVTSDPPPTRSAEKSIAFEIALSPHDVTEINIAATCEISPARRESVLFGDAYDGARTMRTERLAGRCDLTTSNELFDVWVNRSLSDIDMMMTTTPEGPYPYAGIPWFSCPFGRDGIITALETLWVNADLARGVLRYLAASQAQEVDPARDAQPGKILHEARLGEMAALREVPFGRYYGSIDATPLFLMLAGAYYRRTADLDCMATLWPNLVLALEWIDRFGDLDGDGFVEYARQSADGLVQQGWKDSQDSVFHADGHIASPPIALAEVQGYVYAARRELSVIADALGHSDRAEDLRRQADRLREEFDRRFWSDDLGTYAIALDGEKRPCLVRSSNAGHCLYTGIASAPRAARTCEALMDGEAFSGWGVRTIASGQARYNPMSYHNGSIWPHDNAIVAAGFARYGFKNAALRILSGLFDASVHLDLNRLPELFCGFHRRPGEGPTLYPVACAPQAWASGAVFMLIEAALGMKVDALERRIVFDRPALPDTVDQVRVRNLRVGSATVDLLCERHEHDVGLRVLARSGDVSIVTVN
jgi:glycogen debranching enzyme